MVSAKFVWPILIWQAELMDLWQANPLLLLTSGRSRILSFWRSPSQDFILSFWRSPSHAFTPINAQSSEKRWQEE